MPFKPGDVEFYQCRRIYPAGTHFDDVLIGSGINAREVRHNRDFTKAELLSLGNVVLHKVPVTIARQFGVDRLRAHINIATGQVKIAQQLLIQGNLTFNESIAPYKAAKQAGLLGTKHAAQTTI